MNPLILIGLGAVALMAMGKKKKEPEKGTSQTNGAGEITPVVARKAAVGGVKTQQGAAPPDYAAQINLKGQDLAVQCMNQGHKEEMDLTACIAKKLFPNWDWSNRSGWQSDAWSRIRKVARVKLGKDPIIT